MEADLHGFELKNLDVAAQAVRLQCDGASRRAEGGWVSVAEQQQLPADVKLKAMVRQGVPPPLRSLVWMQTSGAARKKAALSSNYFSSMVLAGDSSPCVQAIEKDAPHTFSNHPWLQQPDGQAALRRVLAAYSVHNPAVGYCRSMGQIVGLLLVALNRNEETAFWLLAALVEDILQPETYDSNLVGCQVEMRALDELIAHKLPRLSAHLHTIEADVSILATDWFLMLFAASMPSETVARVWDALFLEGSKILFRTALAVLKAQEEALLQVDNAGELLLAVRHYTINLHDRDALMAMAFEGIGSMPLAVIDRCRTECSADVAAAVQEHRGQCQPAPGEINSNSSSHMGQLGKTASVLGKTAASNLRKGFASLACKAQEQILAAQQHRQGGSGSGGGGGGSGGGQ